MPPAGPPRVRSDTSRTEVQRIMNEAQGGEVYWSQSSSIWQNLLEARNEFVRDCLHTYGLTTKQYKALPKSNKRHYAAMVEVAFTAADDGFYQYTRDGFWKQTAAGEHNNWINIKGMAQWHVRQALASLEARSNSSATPPLPSGPSSSELGNASAPAFDPVRDSVNENTTNQ